MDMVECGIRKHLFDDRALLVNRTNHPPYTDVRPDDCGSRMALEQGFNLGQVGWLRSLFCKRCIDVIVDQYDQPCLGSKVEEFVERRVFESCNFARDLGGHELLVNREFADS